jgi:hypothetical protein
MSKIDADKDACRRVLLVGVGGIERRRKKKNKSNKIKK